MSEMEVDIETRVSTTGEALTVVSCRRNSGAGEFPARIRPDGQQDHEEIVAQSTGAFVLAVEQSIYESSNGKAVITWPE